MNKQTALSIGIAAAMLVLIIGIVYIGARSFATNTRIGEAVRFEREAAATPPTAETAPPTQPPLTATPATIEPDALLARVNAARCAEGLHPLVPSAHLDAIARTHAEDMVANQFFDHQGSDDSSVADRATAADYAWRAVGENIAAGQQTVDEVFAAWMDSPGHRRNILSPDFQEMGIVTLPAQPDDVYSIYWVQVFGTRLEAGSPSAQCEG